MRNLNWIRTFISGALSRLPATSNYQRSAATLCSGCTTAVEWQVNFSERRPLLAVHSFLNLSSSTSNNSGNPLTFRFDKGLHETEIWSLTQRRFRWRHKLVRAPPTKPLSFDHSGDQTMSVGSVDLKNPKLGFENISELKEADENVKKIFSLEFGTSSALTEKLIHNLLEKVKEHPLDLQSLEVQIASDTIRIRNEIQHCLRYRNDKLNKVRLLKRINKRRLMLADLKCRDIEKFTWLLRELKIRYVEETKYDRWKLSKKGQRKKIARDAAIALKKKKLEEFEKKLEQEKVVFEKYRDAELLRIKLELQGLGIEEMKTLRETFEAMNLGDMLPKPEPKISRRSLLLRKKFILYGERKKVLDEQILKANNFLTEKEMPYLP